jgi:hypothetical protein
MNNNNNNGAEFKIARAISGENINQFDTIDLDDIFSGKQHLS